MLRSYVILMAALVVSVGLCGCGGGGGGGQSGPTPVSWWKADGDINDAVGGNNGALYNGVNYVAGVSGQAFNFDGVLGAISIPDANNLKITGSLTIDAWVKVASYPTISQHSMIVFRGDSRVGLDPYFMTVDPDGLLYFGINDANNVGVNISAPIALHQFVHVTGTLDDTTGSMRLYEDGVQVAQTTTPLRPFRDLDSTAAPGIGIGNHSGFPNSVYNFPFHGVIDEVKIYNQVVPPS